MSKDKDGNDICDCCGEESSDLKDAEERGMLCEDCSAPHLVPCCKCGKNTTWDSTYEDLCFRCCRADNE